MTLDSWEWEDDTQDRTLGNSENKCVQTISIFNRAFSFAFKQDQKKFKVDIMCKLIVTPKEGDLIKTHLELKWKRWTDHWL